MSPVLIIILSLFTLLILFASVIILRGIMFRPIVKEKKKVLPVHINLDKSVSDLARMIRCKTISDNNKENEDEAEFIKFKSLLPDMFPNLFAACLYEEPSDRSILIKWEGRSHDAPTVLMAHFDVVSVNEEKWDHPPFEGFLENGVLWGRGTLDTKGSLNAILQAAEALVQDGFIPANDIYFAFGGDEEINGHGAEDIVVLFKERGITPGVVLDEGGAVIPNIFPGESIYGALIGIAEKGMLNVEYSVSGGGGHASSPEPNTPIGRLSAACSAIERKTPFKQRFCTPAVEMFKAFARHATLPYRIIFSNLNIFKPVLNILTKKRGGEFNALVRTTVAFTQMNGSKGMNVIPAYATMISNQRIIPGETVDSTVKTLESICAPYGVKVKKIGGFDPSVISRTDCEAYTRVGDAIEATWQDAIISPYLMVACSDSRHWGEISDKVYRFSPMRLSSEERASIHGNNERIPVTTIAQSVEFYTRFIMNS